MCINDHHTIIGGREQDWISHRACEETCNNDLNCYAFQIGYKSCYTFDSTDHWYGDGKMDYQITLRTRAIKTEDWYCYTNERNLEQCSGENCEGYKGYQTKTKSGRPCQAWDAFTPYLVNPSYQDWVFNNTQIP